MSDADTWERYEEDIARLRHELEARGGPPSHVGINNLSSHNSGFAGPAPPVIGHGPSNLFGGIMTTPGAQGQLGLAPLNADQAQGPPNAPSSSSQHLVSHGPAGPASQHQFNGAYGATPVINGEPKPGESICQQLMSGYSNQLASPGGKQRGAPASRALANTPHQNQPATYHNASSPMTSRASPAPTQQFSNIGNKLADLNPDDIRPDRKREGQDWFAVFNPNVRRVLDIDLVCNLAHESVVCCVRFSYDGTKVATGCNRSAQIFDVATGNKLTTLQDESVDKDGDLYIRSVCFSPDAVFLATGAEDKQIRVSSSVWRWAVSLMGFAGMGYRNSDHTSLLFRS